MFESEVRLRRASDDRFRWFLGRAVPLRHENGTILRWYGTLTDIGRIGSARSRSAINCTGSRPSWFTSAGSPPWAS